MAGKIPRSLVNTLNKLTWFETSTDCHYKMINGERVMQSRPEGTVWFAWTGSDEGLALAAALRNSEAKIDAHHDFVGDVFGISVAPSQLPGLAENGVAFARKALKDPSLKRIEPPVRARG